MDKKGERWDMSDQGGEQAIEREPETIQIYRC